MKFFRKIAAVLALSALGLAAHASDYPNKPIRLVVPLAPGGGADVAARIVAQEWSTLLGQNIIVENKPGASSAIGTQHVAKAAPDGYTLLLVTDFHAINAAMERLGRLPSKLPYDSFKAFEPVGQLLNLQIALLASKKSGITSVADMTAKAKSMNGGMSAGMLGEGSPHYLAFMTMQQMGGYQLIEVPYGGSGPTAIAVQGGEVDLTFSTVGAAIQMAKGNRVTALAVSGAQRDPLAPQMPTLAESGYPGFDIQSWMGFLAPKGVGADKIARLNSTLNKALASPEVANKLKATGMYPTPGTPEAFGQLISKEAAKVEALYQNKKK